jgi:hypothetical protein
MKVLSEEIENVLKAKEIFWRGLAKRFVGLDHRFCLLSFSRSKRLAFGGLFKRFTFRSAVAIAVDIEDLIQSEPGQKLLTPITAMNNMKVTLPEFF